MATTTIRVSVTTRDRLNALASEFGVDTTTDDVVQALLDHHWRTQCIDEADRRREEQPEHWWTSLRQASALNALLDPQEHAA